MNRKDRRKAEKAAGLLKKNANLSWKDRQEIYERKRIMGRRIHQENTERIYNLEIEEENQKYTKRLNELIAEGYSQEDAKKVLSIDNSAND